ncbi:hypothetical protein AUJ14_03080 [Candidatus Micrarchaeota archaeon CG1_02_55_22]|nr:MAG: hypothetical protein AUJ14_03080 [Candidatus Micrarchaeota archaeon CG1_02_55_22]
MTTRRTASPSAEAIALSRQPRHGNTPVFAQLLAAAHGEEWRAHSLDPKWFSPTKEHYAHAERVLPRRVASLSPREQEIIRLYAHYHDIGEVADAISIDRASAANHWRNALTSLQAMPTGEEHEARQAALTAIIRPSNMLRQILRKTATAAKRRQNPPEGLADAVQELRAGLGLLERDAGKVTVPGHEARVELLPRHADSVADSLKTLRAQARELLERIVPHRDDSEWDKVHGMLKHLANAHIPDGLKKLGRR